MSKLYCIFRDHRNATSITGLLTALFFCISLFYTTTVLADDTVDKIFITADRMQMNITTGKSIYTGNVQISQGELILTGDKVILESKKEELERLIVIGKPARYNHLTENGENIKAESEHMVYTASLNKLVLTINARLEQPDHKLSSQKIIYDTQKKTVIAGDTSDASFDDEGSGESQRVNIILTPKKPLTKQPQP